MKRGTVMKKNEINIAVNNDFLRSVSDVLSQARKNAKTAVNISMVYAYYEIGRMIVEEEQQGENRAAYGKQILKELSAYLTENCGKGFSVGNLKNIRQFYKVYSSDQIGETVFSQFENLPAVSTGRKFFLSWSHYLRLMRIDDVDERHFYEIECVKNNWSLREFQRQFDSALYQRLMLSTEKDAVKQLSEKGQIIEKSSDLVKDPYVLEFLGLEEKTKYSESDLETRIIDNLQTFLLELGAGYTFVARQKRFTFNESHFRVDLVFYNRLLRCFVVFDLKIGTLKHQDLGQMQMYVNYYDRYEKQEDENPTIGVLLCQDKEDSLVELTLPKDSNIYASKYQLYLPDKKMLQKKLQEWIDEETGGEND
jgi:predicted nuclease of restriction endonuclease-like (RecB) superfamily/predicted GNAT family N-acyltransferase